MRKGKNIALLLLAAVIITGCAFLPGMVAVCQDSEELGQTRYETVPDIQLQIRGAEETPAMAKVAMIARMDGGLEISESMADMTREEAEAEALKILQRYMDAGLIQTFEPVVHDSRCMFATVTIDPALNGIYWMVTLVSADEYNYAQLDLAIDDETGAALAVSFASEKSLSAPEREEKLIAFTDLYFSSLEIPDDSHFVSEDINDAYFGENSCMARYHCVDEVYGEVNADLYVYEYGFYTEFPGLGVNG